MQAKYSPKITIQRLICPTCKCVHQKYVGCLQVECDRCAKESE